MQVTYKINQGSGLCGWKNSQRSESEHSSGGEGGRVVGFVCSCAENGWNEKGGWVEAETEKQRARKPEVLKIWLRKKQLKQRQEKRRRNMTMPWQKRGTIKA